MSKIFRSDDGQILQGEPVSLTDLLAGFRQQLEQEAQAPLETLDLNAALMLYDLCNYLGLSAANRDRALGARSGAWVQEALEEDARGRRPPAGMSLN